MNRKFRFMPRNVCFIVDGGDNGGGTTAPPAGDEKKQLEGDQMPSGEGDAKKVKDGEKPKETDWKAEARKWEQRAKANSKAAEEWQKLEDAKKTDLEKATEQIAALTAERDAAKLTVLRAEVAQEAGLPAALAARLTGTDKESMLEDAKALAEHIKPAKPNSSAWKSGDAHVGTKNQPEGGPTSMAEAIAAAYAA